MTEKIEPIDIVECQAEQRTGSFMTLGPRPVVRCKNPPVYIAIEKKPGKDGLTGGTSLCRACSTVMRERMGKDYANIFKFVR